ncbi:hypothetical protein Aph01nite_01540 [Acrocarpospora phusangensis]|uniref:Asl1-like glycosyl hydrolase catalytic domain-containing protein n=1 Tax=Acrocarpospora phusangensis TaxID=1070424 RepID=A0A919UHA7_9ACTN|nr:hypothetical protein [Acrocarpospora phusangensis]GIH21844.1 hypothetical protein Aph01nite_01540 [Acrocarpospora phusangensis]
MIRGRRAAALVLLLSAVTGCSTSAAPPGPVPATAKVGSPFGLKWDGYQHPPRYDADIGAYAGGATFHDIVWCAVEPDRGTRNWALDDRVVSDLLAVRYHVMIRIRIGTCWATGDPADPAPRAAASRPPADLSRYEAFVEDLVRRYAAKGVHQYAIENEIDAENFWAADPAAYGEVGRAGAAAVRRGDLTAIVTDPGLSSSSYGIAVARADDVGARPAEALRVYAAYYARRGTGRFPPAADLDGLRAAFGTPAGRRAIAAHQTVRELGTDGVFDVYQLHYYDPWALLPEILDYIRRDLPAATRVEAWEVGTFWPGPDYDEDTHGTETAKLVVTLLAAGVRRVVYLPLYYRPGTIAPRETWRGLYGADDRPRPAKTVFDQLRLRTATGRWGPLDLRGVAGGVVDLGDRTAFVVWSADGSVVPLAFGEPVGAAEVVALPSGKPRTWGPGPLHVGSDPLLVTLPTPFDRAKRWLESP